MGESSPWKLSRVAQEPKGGAGKWAAGLLSTHPWGPGLPSQPQPFDHSRNASSSCSTRSRSPVPRAAHRPGAILQHPLQVGAILHVAREGAGHHIGAPVSSPCPQRSKRRCLTGGQSPQQSSTRPAGCPCCSPSPPARAPHNSSQPGVPACLSAHEASCPSWFPAQHLRGL